MAHTAIHISLGIMVATAACLPPLLRAWRRGRPLAARFRNWLLWAGGLGTYAIVPVLLRRMGVPEELCRSVWMNVFLFHPLVGRLWSGGGLVGPLMLAGAFGVPYFMLLLAIRLLNRCSEGTANLGTRLSVND